MKTVYIPHLKRQVKLGRKKPKVKCPHLKLSNYLSKAKSLPTPPASVDYSSPASTSLGDIFCNDQLGCCVISGGYHVTGLLTANGSKEFVASDKQIIKDYSAIGGYVPGDSSTDEGCDEQTALNYWTKNGFANGTKLAGWVAVDPQNPTEYRQALYLFEHLYYGIGLPDSWLNNPQPGFVWDADTPDQNNGHCIMAFAYGDKGTDVDTWGMKGLLTDAAHAADVEELYVMLSPDILLKGQQKAPNHLDWTSLIEDLNALGASLPVPPAPPAPIPPVPPVTPGGFQVTLSGTVLAAGPVSFSGSAVAVVGPAYRLSDVERSKLEMELARGLGGCSGRKFTLAQLEAIIALVEQLIPVLWPAVAVHKTSLTPSQWTALIQAILQLLPILFPSI